MEDVVNYRQISPQEAASLDINNIAYYTLVDGSIARIKRDGETKDFQNSGEKIVMQYSQSSGEEEQVKKQFQNDSQNKNILQPGENYGYYISKKRDNIAPPKQQQFQQKQKCTCSRQVPIGYMNYNAKLINLQIAENQIIGHLNMSNPSFPGPQFIQEGGPMKKVQLYKLVHAIPVRLSDNSGKQFVNQNTNSHINFQQYHIQEKMGTNKRPMTQSNQKLFPNEHQREYQEIQGDMNNNEQDIEYCTCDLEIGNEVKCTCPKYH